jgi:hypothetical protein
VCLPVLCKSLDFFNKTCHYVVKGPTCIAFSRVQTPYTCIFYSFFTFVGPCIVIYFYSKTNQMHNISNLFYFGTTLYMFRTNFPSIIRSLRLYIQHHVCVIQVLWLLLAVMVGLTGQNHDQQHCYHQAPTVNQRLLLQLL